MSGSEVWPSCPTCGRTVNAVALEWGKRGEFDPSKPARWWAKPCCCALTAEQHRELSNALRPRWRFDVPEVPPGVTALEDGGGTVWLRLPDDTWTANEYVRNAGARFTHMADSARLPLVECEDPRGTG